MGRKSTYTRKIADEICLRLAQGESLRSICQDEHMPDKATVLRWITSASDLYKAFRDQYAEARSAQREGLFDEILDIADNSANDWMDRETRAGRVVRAPDHEHVQRSNIRIEARKWILARMDKITAIARGELNPEASNTYELVKGPTRPSKIQKADGDEPNG